MVESRSREGSGRDCPMTTAAKKKVREVIEFGKALLEYFSLCRTFDCLKLEILFVKLKSRNTSAANKKPNLTRQPVTGAT